MHVAYLINQYPKVSHSFIRREILALEASGVTVARFAMRGWDAEVVDEADRQERERTRYLLQGGAWPLLKACLGALLHSPSRWWAALRLAWAMTRQSDRPAPIHLIYFLEACRLRQLLAATDVSHVHAHFGTNATEIAMLCHQLGGPRYSFTVHGPEEFDKPQALQLGTKAKHAARVMAISSYGRSQLFRWLDLADWPKVDVVRCGLAAADFVPPANSPAPQPGRLVCIGRLCEQKGQLLLLQAAALVKARGLPFQLVLAGDGEMRGLIEQRIAAEGLGDVVQITGWIDAARVAQELQRACAMVLPSFAEGLPVVIMEALAQARPVISTYVAGIPELVRDGQEGWLVPAGDVQALASAMLACLSASAEQRAAMGASGQMRARQMHLIDHSAAALVASFTQAAKEY
jgi:colanic acid/amylovoran biosynthesis glycosyltransferase